MPDPRNLLAVLLLAAALPLSCAGGPEPVLKEEPHAKKEAAPPEEPAESGSEPEPEPAAPAPAPGEDVGEETDETDPLRDPFDTTWIENLLERRTSRAASLVGLLGDDARPAVPWLIERVPGDIGNPAFAIEREPLSILGDVALPGLLRSVAGRGPFAATSARCVSRIPAGDPALLPLFRTTVEQAEADHAARVLHSLRGLGKGAVPFLAGCLEDERPAVRESAARTLGRIGPGAQGTVSALVNLARDPDGGVRAGAAYALGRTGAPGSLAVPFLADLLDDPRVPVRREAVLALGRFESGESASRAGIVRKAADPAVRWESLPLLMLAEGSESEAVRRAVRERFEAGEDDKDVERLASIVEVLGGWRASKGKAFPFLVEALSFADDVNRETIGGMLDGIDMPPEAAAPVWKRALRHASGPAFDRAVMFFLEANEALGPLRKDLVARLREALEAEHGRPEVVAGILALLAASGRPPDPQLVVKVFEPGRRWPDPVFAEAVRVLAMAPGKALGPLLDLALSRRGGHWHFDRPRWHWRALAARAIAGALPLEERGAARRRIALYPDPTVRFLAAPVPKLVSPAAPRARTWREGDLRVERIATEVSLPRTVQFTALERLGKTGRFLLLTSDGQLYTLASRPDGGVETEAYRDLPLAAHPPDRVPSFLPKIWEYLDASPEGGVFVAAGGDDDPGDRKALLLVYRADEPGPVLAGSLPVRWIRGAALDAEAGRIAAIDDAYGIHWLDVRLDPEPAFLGRASGSGGPDQRSCVLLSDGTVLTGTPQAGLLGARPGRAAHLLFCPEEEDAPVVSGPLPDGTVLFATVTDPAVRKMDPGTGRILWTSPLGSSFHRLEAGPVYWAAYGGSEIALGDTETGEVLGRLPLSEEGRATFSGEAHSHHRVVAFGAGGRALMAVAVSQERSWIIRFRLTRRSDRAGAVRGEDGTPSGAVPDGTPLERWIEDLRAERTDVRHAAASELGRLRGKARRALPALRQAIEEEMDAERPDAAFLSLLVDALGGIGKEAVPALAGLLEAQDPGVRAKACRALARLGPRAREASFPLAGRLGDIDWDVRLEAARALHALRPEARGAAVALRGALDDRSLRVREAALAALIAMGEAARLPLEAGLPESGGFQALYTIEALSALGVFEKKPLLLQTALSQLEGLLESGDALLRSESARVCGRLGPLAAPILQSLELGLFDEHFEVQRRTAESLRRVGGGSELGVSVLAGTLASEDPVLRRRCARALATLGPASPAALPALLEALEDGDGFVRAYAAEALRGMGSEGFEALAGRLGSSDPFLCEEAAHAFQGAGREALPALLAALQAEGSRGWGAVALGWMGPAASEAAPALEALAGDGDPWVRSVAAKARRRIAGRDAGR